MASSKKVQLLDKWASKLFPFNYNLGQPTSPSLKYFLYYKLESGNALILKYLHDNIKKHLSSCFSKSAPSYFHFPDKETIYRNSGTSLSLTNNFVSLNGELLRGVPALNGVFKKYFLKKVSLIEMGITIIYN